MLQNRDGTDSFDSVRTAHTVFAGWIIEDRDPVPYEASVIV